MLELQAVNATSEKNFTAQLVSDPSLECLPIKRRSNRRPPCSQTCRLAQRQTYPVKGESGRYRTVASSLSSASAGSGQNRLVRRGEAEPVLTMSKGTSGGLLRLWLRPRPITTDVSLELDFFLREDVFGNFGWGADSRRAGGLSSSSSISFKDVVTTGPDARAVLLCLRRESKSSSGGIQLGATGLGYDRVG